MREPVTEFRSWLPFAGRNRLERYAEPSQVPVTVTVGLLNRSASECNRLAAYRM